jgi:pyridoxamine 5'-phosphate oxidase
VTQDQRDTRRHYDQGELRRADLQADPVDQFSSWLQAAIDAELVDATAMTLATADSAGRPSARILLLKEFSATGYSWFTDYGSQKGRELQTNPYATLLFYWREFERQVRISGPVERLDRKASEAYFASRPSESQISAAASEQSEPIEDRAALQTKVAELEARYGVEEIPMPSNWGGYRLIAEEYEFWQGRVGRLHDRFRYRLNDHLNERGWDIERLQP